MTGQEAIELIHQRAWTGRKPGLERTQALLASLGNPERRLRFVHITGTNGKGSTAAMTASILAQAGLRAGLFTSPHLYRFHERMQVNGAPIPDEVLGGLTQQVLEVAEGMSDPPTEFELMTAVGMEFFLEEQCDIVVLEVGLGGRLDSTNVIPAPEAAVITNIGLEHVEQLGDTPVYFTLDLDVLDPSVFPGTGTPEPGGVSFEELRKAVTLVCQKANVVACDVNELSPPYDQSGVSTMVACKVVREMLLALN